jgi:hypothetical protein
MNIITSISTNHKNSDQQLTALKSWQPHGKCYSLNSEKEISILKNQGYGGVEFVQTDRIIEHYIGKPLVSINAIIDFAKSLEGDLLLINSDILLIGLPELKQDGITIFSRYDYTNTFEDAKMFPHGFDVFHIPKQFLNIFPPSIYGLGATHWDHSIPFHVMVKNIPLYSPKERYAYHKIHEIQYNIRQWEYIGEFFRWEFKFQKQLLIGQIATMAMQRINNYLTRF